MFKIVVLDDEEMVRYGLIKIIRNLNNKFHVVGEAENGEEGLKLIRTLEPDIVFSDIRMPRGNGLEILKKIYLENIRCKTIILTAYADFEYARKAIEYGASGYILKPINEEVVKSELYKVAKIIDNACMIMSEEEISRNLVCEILSQNMYTNPLVRKTIKYIENNYKRDIHLEDIANELNVTPTYISSLFTKNLNTNFINFLNTFRINISKKLLEKANYKIFEISDMVGFNNSKYFCKIFKEIVGVSPSEYKYNVSARD